jgi:hypothetical protein
MPSYLESVILNVAEYYRSAIVTIVGRAKKENMASDIDQVVSEIGIKYGIMRSHFRNGKPETALTKDQVGKIMDTR